MNLNDSIVITGGGGLVGNALTALLQRKGYTNVCSLRSTDGDLTQWDAVRGLFARLAPAYVFHLAARVYGIRGNMENKGVAFRDNVLINTHVVEACRLCGVRKIVAMGSGCVYPYPSPGLPLKEDMVWQGKPHDSEDSYAHAKRAMLAQLIAYHEQYGLPFAFVISANLYGPHDKFDVEHGHVTPALVRKFFEAKQSGGRVTVWGNGTARRDFIYASDVATALIHIMQQVDGPVNMGSGHVHSIRDIVDALSDITGLAGRVDWDSSKPNGQDYREYDLSTLQRTGFRAAVPLVQGLRQTYSWYEASSNVARQ
jgi:GDP-L-fucose synthase